MAPEHCDSHACSAQHPRDELRELAIAEHGDFAMRGYAHLFEDLASRRQRFGEDGLFIRHARRNGVQVR